MLWPILRFFGFSRLGPVKGLLATWMVNIVNLSGYFKLLLGSIAARAQSFFYGAKVPKAGLFAWFQSVGMKIGEVLLAILKFFWPF